MTYSRSADLRAMRLYKYSQMPPQLSNRNQVPIVEHHLMRILSDQGFDLDVERDNKSVVDVDKLYASLHRYKGSKEVPRGPVLSQAIDLAFKTFAGDRSLTPLTDEDELRQAVKLDKSSGLPQMTNKRDAFSKDFRLSQRFVKGEKTKRIPPCVSYHRVQHGDNGPKTRLVWGFPLSMTIVEARFARPLIDKFLRHYSPMAFGLHKMDLMARSQEIENAPVRLGLDISGFDASIKPNLIHAAFNILRTWFEDIEENRVAWEVIERYFIHTPILMPDSYVYVKHQGVPSGSYFTQLIDSIVNYILVQYINIRLNDVPVPNSRVLVLGDDSLVGIAYWPNLHEVSDIAQELGFEINTRKSERSRFGEPMTFLGQSWSRGLPRRDMDELIKRVVFPEVISGIDDPEVRRTTRVVSLAGVSVEGMNLMRSVGFAPRQVFRSSLNVRPDKISTGWLDLLASQGDTSAEYTPFEYLATSLYR